MDYLASDCDKAWPNAETVKLYGQKRQTFSILIINKFGVACQDKLLPFLLRSMV